MQGPGQVRGKRPGFSERRSGSGKHIYATTRSARILTNGIVDTGADKYRQTSVRDGTVGAGRRRSSRDNIRGALATPRRVSADEIESLAIGAWVLGIGGGPYLALLNMRAFYRQGASVSLIDPLDLADDDLVAVVSNMGAPLVGQERLTDPRTIARAVTMMEEYLATGATGAGWESTPWRATQRAAWEALRKASQEASAQSALRAALQEGRANGNP